VLVHETNTQFVDTGCGNNTWQQDTAPPMEYGGYNSSGGDSGGNDGFDFHSTSEAQDEETVYDNGSLKQKYFKWIFLKSSTCCLWSRELGTMIPNNEPYGPYWMFSSFQHVSTGIDGLVVGGSVSIESADAITTVGKFNASVHLAYNVTVSLGYEGYPIIARYSDSQTAYFSAN
jgi:hypothetical protein